MFKILSIGNSFSQDAQRYLCRLAASDGREFMTVNLMIDGCSLKTHWQNAENDLANYSYDINGELNGRKISIREALQQEKWDYITLQQASNESGLEDTYYPFILKLSDYLKQYAPDVKQVIHQTWAYETDSTHGGFVNYGNSQTAMYDALSKAYERVSKELRLQMIPSGKIIQALRSTPEFDHSNGGISLCRDGFHMSLDYGRYAVALTWYRFFMGSDLTSVSFIPDEGEKPLDTHKIELIKKTVKEVLSH